MSDQVPRSEARKWLMEMAQQDWWHGNESDPLVQAFDRRFPPPAPPLPACPHCEEPRAVHEFTTGWRVQCKPGCYVGPSAPTKVAAIRLVTIREEIAEARGRVMALREAREFGGTGIRDLLHKWQSILDDRESEASALREQRHA